jgi:hypothetical protein
MATILRHNAAMPITRAVILETKAAIFIIIPPYFYAVKKLIFIIKAVQAIVFQRFQKKDKTPGHIFGGCNNNLFFIFGKIHKFFFEIA